MKKILLLLLFFNGFDGLVTSFLLSKGIGEELNPLMSWVFCKSPILFIFVKTAWIALCLWVFWKFKELKFAQRAAVFLFFVFLLLFLYESVLLLALVV